MIYHKFINSFLFQKKNEFNSINILLTIENRDPIGPAFLVYYIDFGMIPYSRNIEQKQIIFKNEANIVIPNYANLSKDNNETYFIYFRFNTTLSKLSAKIIYENIIYLEDQTYIILEPGINKIKFSRNIDHYLNITKYNRNKRNTKANYTIYKDEKIFEQNIINDTDNIIYIEEPVYRENIKLKIESDDEILLRVSPEKFEDFSILSYDTNIDIKQIENNLRVKFNTTNYKSRLEYQIALIEKEDNIDSLLIHKKFYENNLIYKNIIYSSGKESIDMNISLINDINNNNFDKDYTLIGYGKEYYGDSINYFYMDPISLFISNPIKTNTKEESNTIINIPSTYVIKNIDNPIIGPTISSKITTTTTTSTSTATATSTTIISKKDDIKETNVIESKSSSEEKSDKIIVEPITTPITSLEETDNNKEPIPDIIRDNHSDNNKTNIIAIVFSAIGGAIILTGIVGLTI